MKLAHDICRCHDETCERKIVCARYVLRETGGDWTGHTQTMKDHNGDCFFFIDMNRESNTP